MREFAQDPSTHAPQKEGSFLPRMNDRGILSRFCERNSTRLPRLTSSLV